MSLALLANRSEPDSQDLRRYSPIQVASPLRVELSCSLDKSLPYHYSAAESRAEPHKDFYIIQELCDIRGFALADVPLSCAHLF